MPNQYAASTTYGSPQTNGGSLSSTYGSPQSNSYGVVIHSMANCYSQYGSNCYSQYGSSSSSANPYGNSQSNRGSSASNYGSPQTSGCTDGSQHSVGYGSSSSSSHTYDSPTSAHGGSGTGISTSYCRYDASSVNNPSISSSSSRVGSTAVGYGRKYGSSSQSNSDASYSGQNGKDVASSNSVNSGSLMVNNPSPSSSPSGAILSLYGGGYSPSTRNKPTSAEISASDSSQRTAAAMEQASSGFSGATGLTFGHSDRGSRYESYPNKFSGGSSTTGGTRLPSASDQIARNYYFSSASRQSEANDVR